MRFFGKIRGTSDDYYVVEATAEGGEAEEEVDPENPEKEEEKLSLIHI